MHDYDVPAQDDYARIVASNIRAARSRVRPDLTQVTVANRMRKLGFRWHHQTTGAVERGERPVTAYELGALALVMGTTAEVLLTPPPDVSVVLFGEQPVPAQRMQLLDDSVTWDGDDIKVTAPTEQYRPGDLQLEKRRQQVAALEGLLADLRQADSDDHGI